MIKWSIITLAQQVLGSVQLLYVEVVIFLHLELVMVLCIWWLLKQVPFGLYSSFHWWGYLTSTSNASGSSLRRRLSGYFSASASASTRTIQSLSAIMIITITRTRTLITALAFVAGSFLDLLLSGSTINYFPRSLYRYLLTIRVLGVLNQ